MHPNDLIWFREHVTKPKMQQILQNTTIPEGYCCITHLDISLLDGRSCGVESALALKGLRSTNGKIEEYAYQTYDFEYSDFFDTHKNCIFLSDGTLHIWDELQQMEVTTILSNLASCAEIFPLLQQFATLQVEHMPLAYLKMKQLFEEETKDRLDQKIRSADSAQGVLTHTQTQDLHTSEPDL